MLKYFFVLLASCFACHIYAQQPTLEQTLSIIKPEAVANNDIGGIIGYIEGADLQVIGLKMTLLSKEQAEKFYEVHKDRPFYQELVNYMSSGPIVAIVLQGQDAVAKYRKVMGATNPEKAEPGTIRADFGTSITKNAVHGSDSLENAKNEIAFFFKSNEIFNHPMQSNN